MGGGTATAERQLSAHPSSVADARRLVRQALTDAGRADLLDDAELLTSEVVTNAVVHAGTEVGVVVHVRDSGLRVEVVDRSPHLPLLRRYTTLSGTGRGLRMLEQLVDRWGVLMSEGSKTVWFELSSATPEERRLAELVVLDDGDVKPAAETVHVVLLNVPLLLHAAWQQHASTLLREFLLSRLDDESAMHEIEVHAAASDAMAFLEQFVPAPDLAEDPDALMAAATEPLVSAERLVLSLPADSVAQFQRLDDTLDAAAELADSGAFLTQPTQPEIRAFRRWVCGEVREQARGGEPTPWDPDVESAAQPASDDLPWDPVTVADSNGSLIAADSTNRILAVSQPALTLLGYQDPAELVGRRLVDIVPERYRQAHLAGFTLYFAEGRAPLIDQPVNVPALHKDGSERAVQLTVRAQHLSDGRQVFVGEFRSPD